jgi:hypothetical protein
MKLSDNLYVGKILNVEIQGDACECNPIMRYDSSYKPIFRFDMTHTSPNTEK